MWQKLAWLALAGAIGTLARYGLTYAVTRLFGGQFPWGTLAVNCVGCFAFGFVWGLAEQRLLLTPETRVIALTGFMGAFTTFSSFAYETVAEFQRSQWLFGIANIAANNVLGIIAVILGLALGRAL